MEEILGNGKLKKCISQDSQQADSVNHPARKENHDRRKWLIYWFSNLLFQENGSIYKEFSLFKLIGLNGNVWLMLLLKEKIQFSSAFLSLFPLILHTKANSTHG